MFTTRYLVVIPWSVEVDFRSRILPGTETKRFDICYQYLYLVVVLEWYLVLYLVVVE